MAYLLVFIFDFNNLTIYIPYNEMNSLAKKHDVSCSARVT